MTNDIKERVDNRDDLLREKERLKEAIKMRKASIGKSFGDIRDELNPLSIFSGSGNKNGIGSGSNIFSNMGSSPLVSMAVSTAANFLLRNVFLKKAGILPRLVLPFVVKKASEFIMAPRLNEKLVGGIRNAADKIRQTDVGDVLPEVKEIVPDKALNAVAKTSEKIADKLHDTAEKIRPDEKPATLYSSSLLKKNPNKKLAKKLHQLADRIRG